MGSMGLPNPFQAQVPQGGIANGPQVGPNASLAMKQTAGAQIAQAMTQMLTGYVSAKQAREQHYDQKYQSAVQDIINGTNPNPDYHEIMKWAKLSGRPINLSVNKPEAEAALLAPKQAQQADQALAYQQQAYSNGQPVQSPAGGSEAGSGTPPQGQAPAQQGIFHRITQRLFPGSEDIPEGTQMEQMLRGLQGVGQSAGGAPGAAARGKEGSLLDIQAHQAATKLGLTHDENMLPLYANTLKKALSGDPQSMQMLEQFGVGKSNPLNDYKVLQTLLDPTADPATIGQRAGELGYQLQMGMPQFKMKMYELAAAPERLAMFGNDFSKSFANLMDPQNGPKAGYSPSQLSQLADADAKEGTKAEAFAAAHSKYYSEVMDQFPDAPPQLLNIYANAKAADQNETAQSVLKFIGGDVTTKQPARYKTKNQWETTRFDQRLGFDYSNFQGNLAVRAGELEDHKLQTVLGALRDQPGTQAAMHVLENQKDYSGDQIRDAYKTIQQSSQNLKDLKVSYNGKELPVTNPQDLVMNYNWGGTGWAYGRPSLTPGAPPSSALQQFYAPPPPTKTNVDELTNRLKKMTPEEQEALGIPAWMRVTQ